MSEEIDESQTPELAVLISVVAVDSESVKDAKKLRLEIEGDADIIMSFAELNVGLLHSVFGHKFALTDAQGNAITPGPQIIDPLDMGDDPGTE